MKKVVVTGMGCLTPIGNNVQAFSENLFKGTCAVGPITKFDAEKFPVKNACELKNFDPSASFQVLDPFIQYGITAVTEAIQYSGLAVSSLDPYRIGVTMSSSKGGFTTIEKFYERLMKRPSALLGARVYSNSIPNILSQWIARRWKINGPAKPVVAACATGTMAIIEGIRMIEDDEVDVCFAGASDASITRLLMAGYKQLGVLSSSGIYPFDARREGFVLGEGAAAVVLESENHAQARGAKIYGKILSYAFGNESKDIISFPVDGDGLEKTLRKLIAKSNIKSEEIDSLELHGTGTQTGDLYETAHIKRAFGKSAYKIPMSAIKSMIGHSVGAAGAISFVASLISIRNGFIPPTINLEKPDPACDLDYTPNVAKEKEINIAGSISMGLGGHIGAILVGR